MEQQEIWKPVVGYEGFYEVNQFGCVKSLSIRYTTTNGKTYSRKEKILTPTINGNDGYYTVTLTKDGKCKRTLVHRIVAMAFIPNPNKLPFIDHINTIKTDNRVENLHWVTQKGNMNNPITKKLVATNSQTKDVKERRMKTRINRKTFSSPRHVYVYKDDIYIGDFISIAETARIMGFSENGVRVALDNQNRTVHGHKVYSKRLEPQKYGSNLNDTNNKVHQSIQLTLW